MKEKIVGVGVFIIVVGVALVAVSLAIVPFTITEPIELEMSSYWLNEAFIVSAGTHQVRLGEILSGTKIGIQFEVTSGIDSDMYFFVADETSYWRWTAGDAADMYLPRSRITALDINWTVPNTETWCFVWDNSVSPNNARVTAQIIGYWTKTGYRDVTDYRPLMDSQYAYVGISILLVGVAVTLGGGLIGKAQRAHVERNSKRPSPLLVEEESKELIEGLQKEVEDLKNAVKDLQTTIANLLKRT